MTEAHYKQGGALPFFVTTLVVFVCMAGTLSWFDMLPESPRASAQASVALSSEKEETATPESPEPTRIVIDAINVDSAVVNPSVTDVAILDQALTKGAVHYPVSADLNENGNVLLFGHSSSLPVVHNKNYKIFNRVNELQQGDTIKVQSATHEHVYRVTSVRMDRADNIFVAFNTTKRRLTISTCNSFGDKDERWVVEADFVGSYSLAQEVSL